jgi:MFS family permease
MAKPAFRHLAAGGALTAFVGYSYTTWLPSFLSRSYGMQTGEIGTWLGLILGIPGGIGITLGGWMADRYGSRDTRWYLWIVAVALLASVPFAVAVFLAPSAGLALLCLCVPVMLGNFYQATSFSQTQGLSSLRMRAVGAAVFLFIVNLVGLGAGPYVTGAISDLLEPTYGVESLRWALLCVTLVNVWAALHYFLGGRHLERDLASAASGR